MLGRVGMGIFLVLAALTGAATSAPAAAAQPHPLFASDAPIRLAIRGPLATIRRAAPSSTDAHPATLEILGPSPERHAIRLSARGLSRRRQAVCAFPPLRIDLVERPAAGSLLRGQRRIKLVTHCRPAPDFQQYLLREYAAYRLLNVLTPVSFRVRLAQIDYFEGTGAAPALTRLGFLVEDVDDAARRNGLVEIDTAGVLRTQLRPLETARVAVFQYMIGNLDWSPNVAPAGSECCHNGKLLGAAAGATAGLVPIPYDFDFSGLVDAPYAAPPDRIPVRSVRERHFRGFCIHRAETQAAAAEALAARAELLAALDAVPQMEARTRVRARAYLAAFFEDVSSPEAVASNLLRTCLG